MIKIDIDEQKTFFNLDDIVEEAQEVDFYEDQEVIKSKQKTQADFKQIE